MEGLPRLHESMAYSVVLPDPSDSELVLELEDDPSANPSANPSADLFALAEPALRVSALAVHSLVVPVLAAVLP